MIERAAQTSRQAPDPLLQPMGVRMGGFLRTVPEIGPNRFKSDSICPRIISRLRLYPVVDKTWMLLLYFESESTTIGSDESRGAIAVRVGMAALSVVRRAISNVLIWVSGTELDAM